MKFIRNIAVALSFSTLALTGVSAAGTAEYPLQVDWSFNGPLGKFDLPSAQRGWQVYKQVCSSCHSLKYFRFRDLAGIGYDEDMIKAFAAEYEVDGEPDEYGDETVRSALPQDVLPAPFANDNAARSANGGALPPDLSLMVKARHDGANYVYSLMVGYNDAPADFELSDGLHYNPYFKGSQIAMAGPLAEGLIDYEDGTAATPDQMAKDVVQFLQYVAEPSLQERHEMGIKVLLFLALLTLLLYISMKVIWKPVKEGKNFYEE